jgi:hypothetical protein
MTAVQNGGAVFAEQPWIAESTKAAFRALDSVPLIGRLVGTLVAFVDALATWTTSLFRAGDVPNGAAVLSYSTQLGVGKWVQSILGYPMDYLQAPTRYALQHANPTIIPTQAAIDEMHLAGVFNREQWECYTRFNGHTPRLHYESVKANRTRIGVNDIVTAYKRGMLTAEGFYGKMRERGVLTREEADEFLKLFTQLPTLSDLMRWLKKDVANEAFVELGQLKEGFAESWSGQFQAWADAQGITPEQAIYEYMATWEFPSNTQLYEMAARLRPGRVSDDIAVSKEMALQVLKINDIAPAWQERLLAISHLPVNQTAIKAAYVAGVIDEAEVRERFKDLKYNQADAEMLTRFVIQSGRQALVASSGTWTRRATGRAYQEGTISRADADRLLTRGVPDPVMRQTILDDQDLLRAAKSRQKCIKGIHRRMMTGEFSGEQAYNALSDLGLDRLQAEDLMRGWHCERASRSKEPTVNMLKQWAVNGIIGAGELLRRLGNLGYTDYDAQAIAASLNVDQARKARDAAIKEMEKKKKELEKAIKELEKRKKEMEKEGDKG